MTPDMVIEIGRQALVVTALLAAPLLISALAVGLLVGMFQAATQIQDMTLSIALGLTGHWMLGLLIDYTRNLFLMIPGISA